MLTGTVILNCLYVTARLEKVSSCQMELTSAAIRLDSDKNHLAHLNKRFLMV